VFVLHFQTNGGSVNNSSRLNQQTLLFPILDNIDYKGKGKVKFLSAHDMKAYRELGG
jgi:hypothetical protein